MTKAQEFRFYFPAWNDCCRANGWHTVKSRLIWEWERMGAEARQALTLGQQRAAKHGKTVTLDDLRHGAHWVALGHDKSHVDFTNDETDRVVALFRVMEDPENLDASILWQAYCDFDSGKSKNNPGAVKRTDYFIEHAAPEAYVRHIAECKFGTRMWEWLDQRQKADLARTLSQRKRSKTPHAKGAKGAKQETAVPAENCPF